MDSDRERMERPALVAALNAAEAEVARLTAALDAAQALLGHTQAAVRWLLDYGWEDEVHDCRGDFGERETYNPRYEVLTAMGEDASLPYFEDDSGEHWPVSDAVEVAMARAAREAGGDPA